MKYSLRFFDKIQEIDGKLVDRFVSFADERFFYASDLGTCYKEEAGKLLIFNNWSGNGSGLGIPFFKNDKLVFTNKYSHFCDWKHGLSASKKFLDLYNNQCFLKIHGRSFFGLSGKDRSKIFLLEEDGHLEAFCDIKRCSESFVIDILSKTIFRLSGERSLLIKSKAKLRSNSIIFNLVDGRPVFVDEDKEIQFDILRHNDLIHQLESKVGTSICLKDKHSTNSFSISREVMSVINYFNLETDEKAIISQKLSSLMSFLFLKNEFEAGFYLARLLLFGADEKVRLKVELALESIKKGAYPSLDLEGFLHRDFDKLLIR